MTKSNGDIDKTCQVYLSDVASACDVLIHSPHIHGSGRIEKRPFYKISNTDHVNSASTSNCLSIVYVFILRLSQILRTYCAI